MGGGDDEKGGQADSDHREKRRRVGADRLVKDVRPGKLVANLLGETLRCGATRHLWRLGQ